MSRSYKEEDENYTVALKVGLVMGQVYRFQADMI